jgi:post-segregation antitoxin (ccd killing protein)
MNERVTVELDAETLKRAREAGLDLSELLTRAVRRVLPSPPKSDDERKREADAWYAENKTEVDWYNAFIAEHGLFSDNTRKF